MDNTCGTLVLAENYYLVVDIVELNWTLLRDDRLGNETCPLNKYPTVGIFYILILRRPSYMNLLVPGSTYRYLPARLLRLTFSDVDLHHGAPPDSLSISPVYPSNETCTADK